MTLGEAAGQDNSVGEVIVPGGAGGKPIEIGRLVVLFA